MPVVEDDISIRPRLDSDDLRLIRDGLIELVYIRGEAGSNSKCVQLMRWILRWSGK